MLEHKHTSSVPGRFSDRLYVLLRAIVADDNIWIQPSRMRCLRWVACSNTDYQQRENQENHPAKLINP
jgi:hypothetical protein